MNTLLLTIALSLACATDDPSDGAARYRAGVCEREDPEYSERPRLSVREAQPIRTLRIGDMAPALRVAEWNKLGPVEAFREETAYVIAFVPSSNRNIEVLLEAISKLSERFADRPVRVLAVAGQEQRMSAESWNRKADAIKANIRIPLAWDDGVKSRTAYLTACGERQPTTIFVIDQRGRIAWYGPPGATSEILNAVLAGVWNLDQVRSEIESEEDLSWLRIEVIRAQRTTNVDRMIKAGERLTTEFQDLPSLEFAEALRDDLVEFGSELLATDSVFDARKEPRLRALLLKAAERAAKIDRHEKPRSLALLARAQSVNGDRAGALRSARKALDLAEAALPPDRDLIEQLTRDVAEFGTK